jgi:hypothetical protein
MRIDATASSTPENYPKKFCGEEPCVPLYPISDGSSINSAEGWKDRFAIVDVGGADGDNRRCRSGRQVRGVFAEGTEGSGHRGVEKRVVATMPSGQKYEDWIKSRGEDGEAGSS